MKASEQPQAIVDTAQAMLPVADKLNTRQEDLIASALMALAIAQEIESDP